MVLDSISHQSKLDPFTLSPPSQSEEPTENIWGVFTPAAIWQLHRGSQNQWCHRDEDSSLATQQWAGGWNRPLDVYFGKSAGKSGGCWDGRRVEHWAEDRFSWEELDDSEYNETSPWQIHKDLCYFCPPSHSNKDIKSALIKGDLFISWCGTDTWNSHCPFCILCKHMRHWHSLCQENLWCPGSAPTLPWNPD